MATRQFLGGAVEIAQETIIVPANVSVGNVFTLASPNGNSLSFTATAATVANVTAGLAAAFRASSGVPNEFNPQETVATDMTTYLLLTAGSPGKPFTVVPSATTGTGTTVPTLVINPAIAAPSDLTPADNGPATGTLLANTTYYYLITSLTAFGESLPSAEVSVTTAADALDTHSIDLPWTPIPGATGYRIYQSQTSGMELLLELVPGGGSNDATDDGSLTPAGNPPAIDTTSGNVVSSGSEDWNTPANWTGQTVPIAGDVPILAEFAGDIAYGLDQSAVALNAISSYASFTGKLGLPSINTDNPNFPYPEYRPRYLTTGAANVFIGIGNGSGCTRFKFAAIGATNVTVYATGASADQNLETVLLIPNTAGSKVTVLSGSVGVGVLSGETGAFGTLIIGNQGNPTSDATVRVGGGITSLATVSKYGGTLTIGCAITTFLQGAAGETTITAGAVTTMTVQQGTVFYNSTSTIGTLTLSNVNGGDGTLDLSQSGHAALSLTITNPVQLYAGSTFNDPNGTVVNGTAFKLNQCQIADVALVVGPNHTLTLS